ncbi:MAG: RNA polymerase factor sigma-54 [Candidatus Rokuibacteriota bacterium]
MAMEARLVPRLSQKVVMTPALQQAIRLLQLSTLELHEEIQQELLENPLLEEVPPDSPTEASAEETPDLAPEEAAAVPDVPTTPTAEAPVAADGADKGERGTDELPFDINAVLFEMDAPEERSLVQQEDREDLPFENMLRSTTSLADHLDVQLRDETDDSLTRRIGTEIIGNLDEDGYLRAELEEVAKRCETTVDEVRRVLAIVQSFDPPGVGARSIQECLLIQLMGMNDPIPDPVSVEIVQAHFEDLSRRRYADIAKALKLPLDRVMESIEEIMGLEPKPGRRFGGGDSRYIAPDVYVHKLGSEYTVVLNDDSVPRLRINALYRTLLRGGGDEARQYVEQKLKSAAWLIKSVDQRQRTLRRVSQSIVKFQREFLERGVEYLRPLSLRDVGEDIGMHESTISRVTTNKYVETPQGLFELKYFFHSGIESTNGEMVSSVSVKKKIEGLLAAEDAGRPFSDQEVAQKLQAGGLSIARRTVAKYREELGILPSHQRRLQPRKR